MPNYYLVANKNGFEEPLKTGSADMLLPEQEELNRQEAFRRARGDVSSWGMVKYYLVPKEEWDAQHCPLKAVDYS